MFPALFSLIHRGMLSCQSQFFLSHFLFHPLPFVRSQTDIPSLIVLPSRSPSFPARRPFLALFFFPPSLPLPIPLPVFPLPHTFILPPSTLCNYILLPAFCLFHTFLPFQPSFLLPSLPPLTFPHQASLPYPSFPPHLSSPPFLSHIQHSFPLLPAPRPFHTSPASPRGLLCTTAHVAAGGGRPGPRAAARRGGD